jgi:hypothetical protein
MAFALRKWFSWTTLGCKPFRTVNVGRFDKDAEEISKQRRSWEWRRSVSRVSLLGVSTESIAAADVPIGGTLAATKKLEAKLGIDLTGHPTREEEVMVMAKL